MKLNDVHAIWLTLNRACNLRCKWCYAQKSNFAEEQIMEIELARLIIDTQSIMSVSPSYTLIGGEPLLYPDLEKLLIYMAYRNCKIGVMTNGIALADQDFCQRCITCSQGQIRFNISLKGLSNEEYMRHCGKPVFDSVLQAIENVEKARLNISCSYVISESNVKGLTEFVKRYCALGLGHIPLLFSHCADVVFEAPKPKTMTDIEVDRCFNSQYAEIHRILEGNFALHQSLPLCVCDQAIINLMKSREQLFTSCHLLHESGLVFDTNGGILFCNHLIGTALGKYGVDYHDLESLRAFFESDMIQECRRRLCTMPEEYCGFCTDFLEI